MTIAPGWLETALHHVLLRVAGWAPDEMTCAARDWLARGHVVEVAQAVMFAALAARIPMTSGDLELLKTALTEAGVDSDLLADLELVAVAGMPWYSMVPMYPGRHADQVQEAPSSLDLTGRPTELDSLDDVDRAIMATVADAAGGGVGALWRAWRCPPMPTPWPPPRRLYLVQAGASTRESLAMLTARLQQALIRAGESAPQVEAFRDTADLPPYQRTALACSALLWTAGPTPSIHIANLFDPVDEVGGPGFSASRPTLNEPEREEVLAYLESASPLLSTTAMMEDVIDGRRRGVVPMSFRTDGEWVWTDAVSYYLRTYGLAPDPRLLQHIRTVRYEIPQVDVVAQHRALAALQAVTTGEDP